MTTALKNIANRKDNHATNKNTLLKGRSGEKINITVMI
jgi:hypothetical protein